MYDLIIIGGGPAGMTAAIYASRARLNTILIEQNFANGGQILNTYIVDNYPGLPGISGLDLAQKMQDHAEEMGVETVNATVEGLDLSGDVKRVLTDDGTYEARTVIIASGATHMKLGVQGEKRLTGKGVSYCATCDGALYKGKDVLVAGGGNVAVEDAIYLAKVCRKVYIVHSGEELRADKMLQETLLSFPNTELVPNSSLAAINGDKIVESASILNKTDGTTTDLPVSGVFIAVGITTRSEFARNSIEMDAGGYIIADETGETGLPGVYAAGDVRAKRLRQVVTAVADGANAAVSAGRYLAKLRRKK